MDLGLDGKVALVLGAGGGLGSAVSQVLAAEGAMVALADISQGALQRSQQSLPSSGSKRSILPWDITDLDQADTNIAKIESDLGPIDVLVNITGGPPPTPAAGQDPGLWAEHFRSMVLSVISITDRVLPKMRKRKWGRIITSTSTGVVTPIPNLAISNTLRLSLVGWSKTLSREVAGDGLTVNVVVPGRVSTQRTKFLDEQKAKRERSSVNAVSAESAASIPAGRYGEPREYADVVAFLASERASYVTGSVIRVDGGLISSI